MYTPPADLPEAVLREALSEGWGFRPTSLAYLAVGFGSHHWLTVDSGGLKLFVTVDDLTEKLRDDADTTEAVFGRLGQAFASALSLRRDAGLDFVVAPLPATGGRVLRRLTGRYSLVAHPYLADCHSAQDGEFESSADRRAVLALLVRLHRATAARPPADNFEIPCRAGLLAAMHSTGQPWQAGPYGTLIMVQRGFPSAKRRIGIPTFRVAIHALGRPEQTCYEPSTSRFKGDHVNDRRGDMRFQPVGSGFVLTKHMIAVGGQRHEIGDGLIGFLLFLAFALVGSVILLTRTNAVPRTAAGVGVDNQIAGD